MTVSYTAEVATCRGLGCFLKLLLRWRASIYKLVWLELAIFLMIYYSLSAIYRFLLDDHQKKIFEYIVAYCNEYSDYIPLAFVMGFYVTIVMTRWWNQYTAIPWPDSIAVFVSATIHGNDERGRLMRRTIVRYVCVCLTLVLTNVSPRVKKRFPTLDHFVDAGLLLENELTIFQSLNQKYPKPSKHWLPIVWASSIVTRARKEGRIRDDFAVKTLIDELNKFRGNCGTLIQYDNISIPLVYTQVVTLAVYSYFISSVMGGQWVQNKSSSAIDLYFPFFTTLRFFFYMGWLKVAETLINPFGEDDDDFEVNWLVDRNLQVSYLIVDEMHHEHPELIRDQYWDEVFPIELPYTAASEPFREEHPEPSTANIQLSAAQQEILPSSVRIDEMVPPDYQLKDIRTDVADDAVSGIHFHAGKISRSTSRISNRERNMSLGSTPSNIGGSLTRIGSVTSVLKRMFSKEDRPDGSSVKTPGLLPSSSSAASLQNQRQIGPGGSMRIGVIEEVDENAMTMTSMRPEYRPPHVNSIFPQGPPPPSEPVDVPRAKDFSNRNGHLLSTSAPAGIVRCRSSSSASRNRPSQSARSSVMYDPSFINDLNEEDNDNESNASSMHSSDESVDEFTKLKVEREKIRADRALGKIARSIENNRQSILDLADGESLLLADLAESSKHAMQSGRYKKDDSSNK
ncbi:bestrophin-4 [Leptopilina heterotoma]|uniref:bestrophin-4 n=1 Tax=Leptopilina heterotoma TaxID=63436 RepID=UPI001CA9DEFA|nr:bestrophin-4 [Leptopilina heterotoma]XP_043477715.1 bestrophin-4 [Leptopilina heterotoma]XP_043477716.1 bestrophin-4 [Leptopilina heterotoma]